MASHQHQLHVWQLSQVCQTFLAHLMLESPVPEHIHGGFQLVKGGSQWMVFVRENPTRIRICLRGTPIFGTPHKGMTGKITRFVKPHPPVSSPYDINGETPELHGVLL